MALTGRVFDYEHYNYCIKCEKKYLKPQNRCSGCNALLRRAPSSGIRLRKFKERLANKMERT